MSRKSRQGTGGGFSLFPFLAVLICTMGSLIVLLVLIVQQSRSGSNQQLAKLTAEPGATAPTTAELPTPQALEDTRWQIDVLKQSREATSERLRKEQLELSMVEDQARELAAKLDRLEVEAQQFEAAESRRLQETAESQAMLSRLQSEKSKADAELSRERTNAKNRGKSFAIVPYDGPQGTDRRPIFVECLADRVVLQPEGIVLVASDFEGTLGPDNPLASALRATREYWLNTRVIPSTSQAYPLLVVRPDGAHTYAACRQAMRGWDDEFGYELIPADTILSYPTADASLAQVLADTIRDRRLRQDRPMPDGRSDAVAALPSNSANSPASQGGGPSQLLLTRDAMGVPNGRVPSGIAGENTPQNSGTTGNARNGNPSNGADDMFVLPPGKRPKTPGSKDSPAGGLENGSAVGGPGGPALIGQTSPSPSSLANTRGDNWALPNSANGSIGMARPVRVRCEPGKLILIPEPGTLEAPQVFSFEGTPASAVPPLVEALWRRIDSWGVAGSGAHWKPILNVECTPDAAQLVAQLSALLDRSGLSVEPVNQPSQGK